MAIPSAPSTRTPKAVHTSHKEHAGPGDAVGVVLDTRPLDRRSSHARQADHAGWLSITRQDQVQSDIAQPRYRRVSTTALGPR